jgi:RNA recognition motif-containing protein
MHNNGKKHQRLLKAREDRKASTERSIYVRGFENRITLENDLNVYFSQFGKVSNIFVDKEKVWYHVYNIQYYNIAFVNSER